MTHRNLAVVVALVFWVLPALAQVQASQSVNRNMAVSQFGMPKDARYVFCETSECPRRSVKHWAPPPEDSKRATSAQLTPVVGDTRPLSIVRPQTPPVCEPLQPSMQSTPLRKPRKRLKRTAIDCKPLKQ